MTPVMATSELDESIATAGAEERADTLATAKKLRSAGIPAPHAEAITEAVRDEMKEFVPKSAIRQDFLALEQRMAAMEERLQRHMDAMEERLQNRFEKNMAQMESRTLRFFATVLAGTLVAMTTIFTFILRGL